VTEISGERKWAADDWLFRVCKNAILADAERPDSPLHPFFEWNDEAAAKASFLESGARPPVQEAAKGYRDQQAVDLLMDVMRRRCAEV
jgi:hypothetical protein